LGDVRVFLSPRTVGKIIEFGFAGILILGFVNLLDPTSAVLLRICLSINPLSGANRFRHHRVGGSRLGFLWWEAPGKRVAG
jgi:hypothetical protein